MQNSSKFIELEKIIHKQVSLELGKFIRQARYKKRKIIVLDVALLFEAKMDKYCDYIIVTKCSKFLQNIRLNRRLLSKEQKEFFHSRQLNLQKKIKKTNSIEYTNSVTMSNFANCYKRTIKACMNR